MLKFEQRLKLFKNPPTLLILEAKDELVKEMIASYKQLVSVNRIEEADEVQQLLKKFKA